MSIEVNLKVLNNFYSFIVEYENKFCDYYHKTSNRLLSLDIFFKKERNFLNKVNFKFKQFTFYFLIKLVIEFLFLFFFYRCLQFYLKCKILIVNYFILLRIFGRA